MSRAAPSRGYDGDLLDAGNRLGRNSLSAFAVFARTLPSAVRGGIFLAGDPRQGHVAVFVAVGDDKPGIVQALDCRRRADGRLSQGLRHAIVRWITPREVTVAVPGAPVEEQRVDVVRRATTLVFGRGDTHERDEALICQRTDAGVRNS